MPAMRLRHTRRRRNPSRCPAPVCGLMQVAGPPPVGVTPVQPRHLPPKPSSTRQKIIAAVIMCAEGYGVGFVFSFSRNLYCIESRPNLELAGVSHR